MSKLTKRVVDAATPRERQFYVWDGDVKGFGLRVTPGGAKSYILNYRTAAGQSRRYTIGKHGSPWTCEEARAKAIEVLRDLTAGIDPLDVKTAKTEAMTVAGCVDLYLAEGPAERVNKKASSWTSDGVCLRRHVIPLIGDRRVNDLTAADLTKLQKDIADGKTRADIKTRKHGRVRVRGGKGIAVRTLAALSAMLSFAKKRQIVEENAAIGVERFKGKSFERFITERELLDIAEALSEIEQSSAIGTSSTNAIRALMLTACRRSEITGLRWEWVDFDRTCLRLPSTKTGERKITLAASAVDLFRAIPRTSPWVFPSSRNDDHVKSLQKAWAVIKKRAMEIAREHAADLGENPDHVPDMSSLRIHDLRHSFASFAVSDGASLFIVGKVLGHRQTSTTEIYAHLRDDPLKAVVDRTGAKIADALKVGAARAKPNAAAAQTDRKPIAPAGRKRNAA